MRTMLIVLISMLLLSVASILCAQEMIVNGSFDGGDGWTVYDMGSNSPSEAEFREDDGEGPLAGAGAYLECLGEDTYTNILVWQELTLVAGTAYEFSGAFKDMTDGELQGLWAEIYLSLEEPVDGVDYAPPGGANEDILISFSSWDEACLPTVDSTFQDHACGTTLYTPPGDSGDVVTVFFGFKTGVWSDAEPYYFDVAVDEFSLVQVGGSAVTSDAAQLTDFSLSPNFPNPFNPTTSIRFSIPIQSTVRLTVLDVKGKTVNVLLDGSLSKGAYSMSWDGQDQEGQALPSGIYLYRLETGNFAETRRMILMK